MLYSKPVPHYLEVNGYCHNYSSTTTNPLTAQVFSRLICETSFNISLVMCLLVLKLRLLILQKRFGKEVVLHLRQRLTHNVSSIVVSADVCKLDHPLLRIGSGGTWSQCAKTSWWSPDCGPCFLGMYPWLSMYMCTRRFNTNECTAGCGSWVFLTHWSNISSRSTLNSYLKWLLKCAINASDLCRMSPGQGYSLKAV